jgi:hypothetical protein
VERLAGGKDKLSTKINLDIKNVFTLDTSASSQTTTNLLDGQNLPRLFVEGLEDGPIASLAEFAENVENFFRLTGQGFLGQFFQLHGANIC